MQDYWNYTIHIHSSYMHVYCVLTRTVEMQHKTNTTILISLLDMWTFCQHSTFDLLMSKEEMKDKGLMGHPIFLFRFLSSFQA